MSSFVESMVHFRLKYFNSLFYMRLSTLNIFSKILSILTSNLFEQLLVPYIFLAFFCNLLSFSGYSAQDQCKTFQNTESRASLSQLSQQQDFLVIILFKQLT